MPRKPPAQIRAAQQRVSKDDRQQIPGASAALQGAIIRLENERLWPEAIRRAYLRWHDAVHHRPFRRNGWAAMPYRRYDYACCEYCTPDIQRANAREVLNVAMRLLPSRSGHELRRLVRQLDQQLFAYGRRDPLVSTDGPWW